MDPKYFWLVMSVEKNDARTIDSESDAWGYLSQCHKFKRTTGAETRLFINNDWHLYKVIRHGTDNYEKVFSNCGNSSSLMIQKLSLITVKKQAKKEAM